MKAITNFTTKYLLINVTMNVIMNFKILINECLHYIFILFYFFIFVIGSTFICKFYEVNFFGKLPQIPIPS